MNSKLGQRITKTLRQIRQERRWTQGELAQKLGLSQSRLSEIEKGKGSLTAEQFITILKLFNLPLNRFVKTKTVDTETQLQKALARLGGVQLKEDVDTLPSEKLSDVYNVILETVLSGSSRLLTALTPVFILHANLSLFKRLLNKFKEYHLENRVYWILDGVHRAIERRRRAFVPYDKRLVYRRAGMLLDEILNFQSAKSKISEYEEDRLDAGIGSRKTLERIRESRDSLAYGWNIITRIREEDFYDALLESEKK